jgi:hypothetical protein
MPPKMTPAKEEHERNTDIALFRYGLIASLLFSPLPIGQVERLLRQIASQNYAIPYSKRKRIGITTLRRYLKQYQQGGFDALRPQERSDKGVPRALTVEVLEKAIALRQEQPARTTPMLVELLKRDPEPVAQRSHPHQPPASEGQDPPPAGAVRSRLPPLRAGCSQRNLAGGCNGRTLAARPEPAWQEETRPSLLLSRRPFPPYSARRILLGGGVAPLGAGSQGGNSQTRTPDIALYR